MGRAVAFFGMLLGERGVLTEASLFRTRPNHVHTYFIKYPAAEYATPKPDGNLTRISPPRVRVWLARLPNNLARNLEIYYSNLIMLLRPNDHQGGSVADSDSHARPGKLDLLFRISARFL